MDIVRGAACPCGRGRNYKKCCLPAETASGAPLDADASPRRKITNFIQPFEHNGMCFAQAREQLGSEIAGAPAGKENRYLDFMDYFVQDFRFPPQGRLLLDLFADARGRSLPAEELVLSTGRLKNWRSFF